MGVFHRMGHIADLDLDAAGHGFDHRYMLFLGGVHGVFHQQRHFLTAADQVRQHNGAKIACGKGICSVQETFSRIFNLADLHTDGSQFDRLLSGGDCIQLGELEIQVIDTPGHTGDSVSYRVGDAVFIGDTLFAPAFGTARCDFPGGDAEQLYESIRKLYELPRETRLFLCHDYPKEGAQPIRFVTVEECMRDNIHIKADTVKSDYVAMREERDAQLGLPRLILPALQINVLAGASPSVESNGAAYLKIPFNQSLEKLIDPK